MLFFKLFNPIPPKLLSSNYVIIDIISEPGHYIKLGRVELRVIEIHNFKKTLSIDYEQAYGENNIIF